jgi:hypothetical protein
MSRKGLRSTIIILAQLQHLGTQSTDQNRQFAASVYRPDDLRAKPIRQALLYV